MIMEIKEQIKASSCLNYYIGFDDVSIMEFHGPEHFIL